MEKSLTDSPLKQLLNKPFILNSPPYQPIGTPKVRLQWTIIEELCVDNRVFFFSILAY